MDKMAPGYHYTWRNNKCIYYIHLSFIQTTWPAPQTICPVSQTICPVSQTTCPTSPKQLVLHPQNNLSYIPKTICPALKNPHVLHPKTICPALKDTCPALKTTCPALKTHLSYFPKTHLSYISKTLVQHQNPIVLHSKQLVLHPQNHLSSIKTTCPASQNNNKTESTPPLVKGTLITFLI